MTRAQIIRGAARAFETLGFAGASLGDVVAESGTTKGAVYFHFTSKESLAREVIAEQHRMSIASVEAVAGADAPALDQIVMLCHEMTRGILEEPVVRAGVRIAHELSAMDGLTAPYVDWVSACRELAEAAIVQGDIIDTVVPEELSRFVVGAFTGVQTLSTVMTERNDLERRVDEMWKLLLPGIVTPQAGERIAAIQAARWEPDGE